MKKIFLTMIIATMSINANVQGKKEYAKCAGCHGQQGEKRAFGKTLPLKGQTKQELEKKMGGYSQGILSMYGMGRMKRELMRGYSKKQISDMAEYISKIKK